MAQLTEKPLRDAFVEQAPAHWIALDLVWRKGKEFIDERADSAAALRALSNRV